MKRQNVLLSLILSLFLAFSGLSGCAPSSSQPEPVVQSSSAVVSSNTGVSSDANTSSDADASSDANAIPQASDIPAYTGEAVVSLNNNIPVFTGSEYTAEYGTEIYGELDELGRCTYAFAVAGPETLPTEPRGDIHTIKPTGWIQAQYDSIPDKSLYNRTHLIAYSLTAENANPSNLITGTNQLNQKTMRPYETQVDAYVDNGGHVLMKVIPVFFGDELVARGVNMQAYSLEDSGKSISYNVFCYNVQPGVAIDYATGQSWLEGTDASTLPNTAPAAPSETSESAASVSSTAATEGATQTYIINSNTHVYHDPTCTSVHHMKEQNRHEVTSTREQLIEEGYRPCKNCTP